MGCPDQRKKTIGDEESLRRWLTENGISGYQPGGRLLDGRYTAGSGLNLRLGLQSVDDLDDEAVELLRRAYTANL